MQEFDLIERFFLPLTCGDVNADKLCDDAYLLNIADFANKGQNIVMSMDIISEGIHFFGHENAGDIAEKALMVNISDLLSAGARIYGYFLGLKLTNKQNEAFMADFCQRLSQLQQQYHCHLLGGDTSVEYGDNCKLTITIHAIGYVDNDDIIRRGNAKISDDIWVTGNLGNAAIGYDIIKQNLKNMTKNHQYFIDCYYRPQPPVILADYLYNIANSAMDISDGLMGDVKHILKAAKVGCELYMDNIPYDKRAEEIYDIEEIMDFILYGGDDYQILFTADKDKLPIIQQISQQTQIKITKIGIITDNIYQCDLYDHENIKTRSIIDYHDKSWQYNINE